MVVVVLLVVYSGGCAASSGGALGLFSRKPKRGRTRPLGRGGIQIASTTPFRLVILQRSGGNAPKCALPSKVEFVRFNALASPWLEQVHDLEALQLILDHAELDHLDPYLQVSKEKLRRAFADVL
jgi:hypothetical protein